ncbi:hypothetical protein [Mesorhizobium kowhaii]|uniref:hypothetical protein n=1 Tax=Mesorhizobium kowhaii TaxID=1300272 RepID=UPI001FDECDD1|nr:hypothetical protein [Mesorhizobium kowhaii]
MVGTAGAAQAAALVEVTLWDKGASVQMPMGLAYATPGIDLAKATMGIRASPGPVKAGEVTFNVRNDSKDTVHEMIVMYLADPSKPLPTLRPRTVPMKTKLAKKAKFRSLIPANRAH